MIFKKRLFILVLLCISLLLCFQIVNGQSRDTGEGEDEIDYGDTSSWSSEEYETAEYSEVEDWNNFDQSQVPPDRIHEIPPDKVDPAKVKDRSKLTADQLAHQNNGETNIEKVPANDLNKEERDKALETIAKDPNEEKTKIETDTDNKKTHITTYDDGFEMDYIYRVKVGDVNFIEAEGFSYRNGILKVNKANTIEINGGILSDVEGFEGNELEFEVNDVKTIINDCITIGNIIDSKFKIDNEELQISTDEESDFDIIDCSGTETTFEAASPESRITVSKDVPPKYKIEQGTLKCTSNDKTDAVIANNQVELDMGIDCFNCMTITPVGTYWYTENSIKDFGIHVPQNSEKYKLCIRKIDGQIFNNSDGIIDLVNNKIELTNIVNYLRYPFEGNQILSPVSENVYESKDENNEVFLTLDNDFLFINNFYLKNPNPKQELAITRFGYHEIVETKDTRFENIQVNKFYPDVIKEYETDFSDAKITIKDKTVTQKGNSKVKILSTNSDNVEKAEFFLIQYWNRLTNILLIDHLD